MAVNVERLVAEPEIVGSTVFAGLDVWVELVQTLRDPVRFVAVTLAKTNLPASAWLMV